MGRKSISKIRREEIIKAFYDVIAEKGMNKATTRQIAEAADCSLGMLHHYFSNKEEIVLAALDFASSMYFDRLERMTPENISVSERLGYGILWYTSMLEFDQKWFRCLHEFRTMALTNQKVADSLKAFFLVSKEILVNNIKEGIETGEYREQDPSVTANLILSSLEGMILLWLSDPESINPKQLGPELKQMVLGYVGYSKKQEKEEEI